MKNNCIITLCCLILGLFQACSPTLSPFTDQLKNDNKWSDSDLKRIQFYLSHDLVLERQVNEGNSTIVSGEIKMVKGRKVEQILIKRGTPGVFVESPKLNHFSVSFEDASDTRTLNFGPNPRRKGAYVLLATSWDNGVGKVRYDGHEYLTNTNGILATLMVDLKKVTKVSVASRSARGRKIGD